MAGTSEPLAYVNLRAVQYQGYWHVVIRVEYETDTVENFDERITRINDTIPYSQEWRDQAWVVLAYAMKHLEHEGATGRSGGMEFPALF